MQAIDGLVQAMADVPAKLNEAAIQVELNTEADLQTAIANALDAKITALEAEDEAQAFYDEDLEEVLAMEDEEEEEKDAFEDVQPVRSATKDPSVEVEVLVSGDVDMEANE